MHRAYYRIEDRDAPRQDPAAALGHHLQLAPQSERRRQRRICRDAREATAGIPVSYWRSPEGIQAWRKNLDHLEAQRNGRARWSSRYEVHICEVKRTYGFERAPPDAE
jgi:hypothetical protein